MKDLTKIVECYSCGLFVQKSDETNISQICPRCESKIETKKDFSIDSLLCNFKFTTIFNFMFISNIEFKFK